MNNPDEDTAVEQFGKGDKYFGVCVMLSTMPGLPMFGHGQLEGYREKYGMEYKKAYWDEEVDVRLEERHKKEIAPILKKPYIFSEVENFYLYDFYSGEGKVDENVFAYSNRFKDERGLVIYQNKFASVTGWTFQSAAYKENDSLKQTNMLDGLGFKANKDSFLCFKDIISGDEFIRSTKEISEKGLYIHLEAYKYHVFCHFRIVEDSKERPYAQLAHHLNGEPVSSIELEMNKWIYRRILDPFREMVNTAAVNGCAVYGMMKKSPKKNLNLIWKKVRA